MLNHIKFNNNDVTLRYMIHEEAEVVQDQINLQQQQFINF